MTIKFKRYPISVEHRGTLLKGVIEYWSKDYRVILEHPLYVEGTSLHMMYMIPARFVTPMDEPVSSKVHDVNIVIRCKEKLKTLFDKAENV